MALPQQVVEQLSQEGSRRTPGWSFGVMLFSGSILLIVLAIYAGLQYGYEPYLNAQISGLQKQVDQLGRSVSPVDEANLVTFYSQISNLQSLVKNHIFFSQLLSWLETNTETNVYFTNMTFTSNDQMTLAGVGKTSADVAEQVAVFEASPDISSLSLSNANYSPTLNAWIFNLIITMKPSVLLWSVSSPAASTSTPSASATTTAAAPMIPAGAAIPTTTTTKP